MSGTRRLRTIAAAAFVFGLVFIGRTLPASAQSGLDERIHSYDVHMLVMANGTIDVTETIDYDFGFNGRHGILREFASTIRYVRHKRGVVACCTLITAVGLLGSPIFSLAVVFADDVFHVSGAQYGLLSACLGAGAVLGSPLVAGRGPGLRRSRLVGDALLVYALALALLRESFSSLEFGSEFL